MKRLILILVLLGISTPTFAEIQGQEVEYQSGDLTFNGYIAYDDSIEGQRPGVIVVHEWWGHNPYVRKRADQLAKMGYVTLAIDMYGDGKLAEHPDTAGKFANEVFSNLEGATDRFKAGMDVLINHPLTIDDKTAAIGYCFGGGTVLHMARFGVDLDGVVSFHGSLATQTPAVAGEVVAEVLVLTGADDPMIPEEAVTAFKSEMESANVTYEVVAYPGVTHSFTNPDADMFADKFGLPLEYNAKADEDSWNRMKTFLSRIFE